MTRLVAALAVIALAGIALSTASAGRNPGRSICHRTSSKTNPYAKLRVSAKQLRAHVKHAADIFPVPSSGCPKTLLTATAGGTAFQIALTGEAETPAGDRSRRVPRRSASARAKDRSATRSRRRTYPRRSPHTSTTAPPAPPGRS